MKADPFGESSLDFPIMFFPYTPLLSNIYIYMCFRFVRTDVSSFGNKIKMMTYGPPAEQLARSRLASSIVKVTSARHWPATPSPILYSSVSPKMYVCMMYRWIRSMMYQCISWEEKVYRLPTCIYRPSNVGGRRHLRSFRNASSMLLSTPCTTDVSLSMYCSNL